MSEHETEAVVRDLDPTSTADNLWDDQRAALRPARTYLGETP